MPAPELALFEELAPFLANPASTEAAPWQKIGAPYEAGGRWFIPAVEPDYDETGRASWYGPGFHGRTTANGELFDQTIPTAAHPTLPIPSLVQVTNLANGRSMVVRVNDRGPFTGDRVIDLSARAAELLDFKDEGTTDVRVRYVGPAPAEPLVTAANLAQAPETVAAAGRPPQTAPPRTAASQTAAPQIALAPTVATRTVPSRTASPRTTSVALANARSASTATAAAPLRSQEANGTGVRPPAARPTGSRLAPARPTSVATSPADRPVMVQLGAFSSRANADRAARQAASLGMVSIRETNSNGRTLYRLVLSVRDPGAVSQARERATGMGLGAVVIASLE
jgi:rare lipoprotein A